MPMNKPYPNKASSKPAQMPKPGNKPGPVKAKTPMPKPGPSKMGVRPAAVKKFLNKYQAGM
jgi:hypothetical protein